MDKIDVQATIRHLGSVGEKIRADEDYYILGPVNFYKHGGNSNSLAHELIESLGCPIPKPPVWVPWWQSDLGDFSPKRK